MPGLAGVDSSKGCQLARLVVMTNREIAFHLMLLVLLLLGGTGFYSYQKSPAMVPALQPLACGAGGAITGRSTRFLRGKGQLPSSNACARR